MTTPETQTVERPDHPAAKLAAAFAQWTTAPAGERTTRMTIDVVDSVGVRVRPVGQVVELTAMQVDRLAAALAGGVEFCTDSGWAIARYLGDWAPVPGEQPAASVVITDLRITDADLDDGITTPEVVRAPIAADQLANVTGYVSESLWLLTTTRNLLLPRAKWQEGQRLRVGTRAVPPRPRKPGPPPQEVAGGLLFDNGASFLDWLDAKLGHPDGEDRESFAGSGHTCVVSHVHVPIPRDGDTGLPEFRYLVRLDTDLGEWTLWLGEDELEPIE